MVFVSDNWILFLTDWVVFYLVGAGFDCFLKRTTNSGVLACLHTFIVLPWCMLGGLVFLGRFDWRGEIVHAVYWCGNGGARVFLIVGSSVSLGHFCDCLADCAGRCKRRVFWLCQVVVRFCGRAGVWSSVPTYGCRFEYSRGVFSGCFVRDWIVRSFVLIGVSVFLVWWGCFSDVVRLDMSRGGVVVCARFLDCCEFCGAGRFCAA